MRDRSEICLDADLVLRNLDSDPEPAISGFWRALERDRTVLHAPSLLRYEVIDQVHRLQKAGKLSVEAAGRMLTTAFQLPIIFHNGDALHLRAFHLAAQYGLPATYDAHYLALAERLGIDFWTTKVRLFEAVGERLPWVRLVG